MSSQVPISTGTATETYYNKWLSFAMDLQRQQPERVLNAGRGQPAALQASTVTTQL